MIDYSKPSTEPRLWVLDLAGTLLFEELVAHGQGLWQSGDQIFQRGGLTSRVLVYDRRRLRRQERLFAPLKSRPGVNDRAHDRAIVIHGAPYVNAEISKALGRLGRSHGCPAVREPVAHQLIDRVKGGGVVFAYYPDRDWLTTSKYLDRCAAQPRASRTSTH